MQRKQQARKADSLLATLLASARVGLMLVGIGGLAIVMFREDGLLQQGLAFMLGSGTRLVVTLFAAFLLYLFWRWLNAAPGGGTTKRGDIPMYAMMALGAFFLFRLITTGAL